jgi:hypothetical protein
MTKHFQPTSKGNPCPVCGDTSGTDRILPDGGVLCKDSNGLRKGEVRNSYVFLKCTKDGLWGIMKPFNGYEKTDRTEDYRRRDWEEKKTERHRQAQLAKQEQQARALSVEQRHAMYSDILNQLSLNAHTISDLKRRGFSPEEIDRSGFKSVSKYQRLNKRFDTRLPGINSDGRALVVDDGYLCPVRNIDGLVVGVQVRLSDPNAGGRYRWLSTPKQATLKIQPNDELPLAVFHPSGEVKGIGFVEGTGAKPFFAAERLGLLSIGAAGGMWLFSPISLKETIQKAILRHSALPFVLALDAGWAVNPHVKKKAIDLMKWLRANFPETEIKVLDWNQLHKSSGDIDEIPDLSVVRWLSLSDFVEKYQAIIDFDNGVGFGRYAAWAENRIKLTADIVQKERWLSIPQGIQEQCDILLIRSPLGTGKTQELIEYLKTQELTSLLIGYRNSLLHNTVERANSLGLVAQHIKEVSDTLQGSYVNFASDLSVKLWAGCADSFPRFDAIISHNPGYNLILDEVVSVLGHLKGGGTLKGKQQSAIRWIVETINQSQFSVMMDGNLCDRHVDFLRGRFPDKRILVLDNRFQHEETRTFYFVETGSTRDEFGRMSKYVPSQLVDIARQHNKVLWLSDSQRSCEVIEEILSNHGHKHFRLDGKTSDTELAKLFQQNPKAFISTEKLDSVSLSPSGESGLSIDLYGYFDAVCFDIKGSVDVNTLLQMSARLRDKSVPIFVSCPSFVNGTPDPCPYAIQRVQEVLNSRLEMLQGKTLEVDNQLVNSDYVLDMFEWMKQTFSSDPWFIEAFQDAHNLKYEHANLGVCLRTALTQSGCRVVDFVEAAREDSHEELKDARESVKRREAEKIFNSQDITWEQAQQLEKREICYDDKCKVRKAKLKHRLPGIDGSESWSPELIYHLVIDKPGFIEERWRLKQLQNKHLFDSVFKLEKKFSLANGFTPQDVWKATSTKIESLKLLGIERIIDSDKFSPQDDWVQQIVDSYYDEPSWFNLIGIPKAKRGENLSCVKKMYVKKMVDRFLDYFGLRSTASGRSKLGKRWYIVQPKELISEEKVSLLPFVYKKEDRSDTHNHSFLDNETLLRDVDEAMERRAATAIAEAQSISLVEIANGAEAKAKADVLWKKEHQPELNRRMLDQSTSVNAIATSPTATAPGQVAIASAAEPTTETIALNPTAIAPSQVAIVESTVQSSSGEVAIGESAIATSGDTPPEDTDDPNVWVELLLSCTSADEIDELTKDWKVNKPKRRKLVWELLGTNGREQIKRLFAGDAIAPSPTAIAQSDVAIVESPMQLLKFKEGDRVRIKQGPNTGVEGTVKYFLGGRVYLGVGRHKDISFKPDDLELVN